MSRTDGGDEQPRDPEPLSQRRDDSAVTERVTGGPVDQSAASYIAAMCIGLVRMAEREHLATLAYLLDMARLEAEARASAHHKLGRTG